MSNMSRLDEKRQAMNNQNQTADMLGRENPHTQAVAISWLNNALRQMLPCHNNYNMMRTACLAWLVTYENYPLDSLIESLKSTLKTDFKWTSEAEFKQTIKDILGAYYDRKC